MSELALECSRCKGVFGRDRFFKNKTKLGVERQCKTCRMELMRAKGGVWRAANKDRIKYLFDRWRNDNRERFRELAKRCRQKTMDRVVARNIQRLQRIKRATPQWADKLAIQDVYVLARVLSREIGLQLDVDHVVPLNGKLVSGLHCESNIQLLPKKENQMKSNTFQEVWP
jgi:hypothetical protein